MNPRSGFVVFRNQYAYLLMYKIVYDQYLTVIFSERDFRVELYSFDDILNIIPIYSLKLNVDLPLLEHLQDTLDAWKKIALQILSRL